MSASPTQSAPPAGASEQPESIGVAIMQPDGTLVLRLRAPLDGGASFGEGQFQYAPGTPDYDAVLQHIGGLAPGQSKPVPPWPDEE